MKACALMKASHKTAAGDEFKNFITKYPDSPRAKDAHAHLVELGFDRRKRSAATDLKMSAPAEQRLSYQDIAGMMEHPVLQPDLSEEEVHTGCEIARQYSVAAVTVRPSDADWPFLGCAAAESPLAAWSAIPHGSSSTSVKLYETRDLLRRGVTEIDTVINLGKMISRQFQYVEMELQQMAEACHEGGAILKVAFENGYLSDDLKTIACKIVKRAGSRLRAHLDALRPRAVLARGRGADEASARRPGENQGQRRRANHL